jgi:putative DNA methylase
MAFCSSSGSFDNMLEWIVKCVDLFPASINSCVKQLDAQSDGSLHNIAISTDPPYYDNIGYADLSDYFYIWMRQALKDTYPEIFRTMLVPKAEELVATPYRFQGNREKARDFFEEGMLQAFQRLYSSANEDIPVTIYYAFKQSEADEDGEGDQQTVSTGWETMLSAIIRAGFTITGTWPIRTEMSNRSVGLGTNALASSIVLVCRKRPPDAPNTTQRDFISALKRELRPALAELQKANIAPVDLAQSAIGPGMAVYSRFAKVLEADGSAMSVRSALAIINQELGLFFAEQDGELDAESRFCVDLYSQFAFNDMKFGEADVLARAKNTAVEKLASQGVLLAQKGVVRLLERAELPDKARPNDKILWMLTQQLTRALESGGVTACAEIVASPFGDNADRAKALAYRLFTIAGDKKWAQEALAYNSLVIAWPEIQAKVAEMKSVRLERGRLL